MVGTEPARSFSTRGAIERRWRHRWLARLASALALVTVALGLLASPAGAHTAFIGATPRDRSVMPTSPPEVTLRFAQPVDPDTTSLRIVRSDGVEVGRGTVVTPRGATPGEESAEVTFRLPPLEPGIYGLPWLTVGPDGHQVIGELVYGIGAVGGAEVAAASGFAGTGGGGGLPLTAAVGRVLWYVGLSLAMGGFVALLRLQPDAEPRVALARIAARCARFGLAAAATGAVLRLSAIVIAVEGARSEAALADRLRGALDPTRTSAVIGVAVGIALAAISLRLRRPAAAVLAMALSIAALARLSHTAELSAHAIDVAVAALHGIAAALWIGPVAVLFIVSRDRGWRSLPASEREPVLADLVRTIGKVALASFAVLAASGIRALWINAGSALGDTDYGRLLTVKVALVAAVVVPLAAHNARMARRQAFARLRPSFELLGFGAVVAVAVALAGLAPGVVTRSPTADGLAFADDASGAAALNATPAASLAECKARTIGLPTCYSEYFVAKLETAGAAAALAEIQANQPTDRHIDGNCHQLAHDVGRRAATFYASVPEALAVDGSPCSYGYYHGLMAEVITSHEPSELPPLIASACSAHEQPPGNATWINCVHGIGHGLQLGFEDYAVALPFCDAIGVRRGVETCATGIFMENAVAGMKGDKAQVKPDDPFYPCPSVPKDLQPFCFAEQPAYVSTVFKRDAGRVLALCGTLDERNADACAFGAAREISIDGRYEPERTLEQCLKAPRDRLVTRCVTGSARGIVLKYRDPRESYRLCDMFPPGKQECYIGVEDILISYGLKARPS